MGIFKHKPEEETPQLNPAGESVDHALDEYFEGVKGKGRSYFEKAVTDHVSVFKKDLDSTIDRVNEQLKDYIKDRLDEQFRQYGVMMKEAQDAALDSLNRSLQDLQEQHKSLAATMQKNVAYQEAVMNHAFKDSQTRLLSLKTTQDSAVATLNREVEELQEQRQQISEVLKKNVTYQEAVLVNVFEENMAMIIENYLLGALGDQYDLKAQLPAILQQMTDNKAAIVEDMKL